MSQKNKHCAALARLFALWLVCRAPSAWALASDSDQPIHIDANTASYEEKTGISTYTGNVVFVQGSIRVTSDKLVVYSRNGEVEKLVWTGGPVKLKQTPNEGKKDITGESLQAEYYPEQALLILKQKATVWQGDVTYTSDMIEYDSRNAIVKAGEKSSDAKRVHVILTPKGKK